MLKHSSLHGNFFVLLWTNGLSAWHLKVLGSLKWGDADNFRYDCLKNVPHFQIFYMQYKLSKFYCNSDMYFIFQILLPVDLAEAKGKLCSLCLMSCFLWGDSLTFCKECQSETRVRH